MSSEPIHLHDKQFVPFLDADTIQASVNKLAKQIDKDYKDLTPICIVVLNGAFMFASDLIKAMQINCEVSFIKLKSYLGTESAGEVSELIGIDIELKGRDIIVIEDIIDTGTTMTQLTKSLKQLEVKSVKLATLLHKPEALAHPMTIDYIGFNIPNKFVIGYGLDYDNLGRQFDAIYQLKIE